MVDLPTQNVCTNTCVHECGEKGWHVQLEWHAAYVDHDVAEKREGLIARFRGVAVLAVAHLQTGARLV